MDDGFIFGSFFNIWDADKNERVTISFGTCRKSISSSYILTLWSGKLHYGFNWSYEWKMWVAKTILFSSTCEVLQSLVGIKVFWPCKYLSLNDEVVQMVIEQCHVIMDGVNNLLKKRVWCRDDVLAMNLWVENIGDVENMSNKIEDLCWRTPKSRGEPTRRFTKV